MERNFRFVIAYDGTDFHGWQRQPGLRTVQAEVEAVLARVVRQPVATIGASRTDAGVHARGQVLNWTADTRIPLIGIRRAVAHRLPQDIALLHADVVRPEFHATRAAREKLYRYRIHNAFLRPAEGLATRTAWHVWHGLDVPRMQAAARALLGRHDFAAFASQGVARSSTVRTITRFEIRRRFHDVWIDVAGDGFLYNQVRNMVGTLVEVGRGHWPVERVTEILASRDRRQAGPTAPAYGLCLQWVRYDPGWQADQAAGEPTEAGPAPVGDRVTPHGDGP